MSESTHYTIKLADLKAARDAAFADYWERVGITELSPATIAIQKAAKESFDLGFAVGIQAGVEVGSKGMMANLSAALQACSG